MRLLDITATAHHDGNRIDLSWSYPVILAKPVGVRVVRGERGHPADPDAGTVVADGIGITSASDRGLKGERAYYYSLFVFRGDPPHFEAEPHNRTAGMALSPYGFADLLYSLLPEIARRYDAGTLPQPGAVARGLQSHGQLRRFLELPGGELDRLYSLARATLSHADPERIDGRLLPLLAQWIGWRTDHRLPLDTQRNEIRAAPRLYQTIGGVAALDAAVTRCTGWSNRTKEFVHNVARTNQPERLNLWAAVRDSSGAFQPPALTSVNFAYDGRPAGVVEADGSALFFYHTQRRQGWNIWAKRYEDGQWHPSEPVVDREITDKHPVAARQGDRLWLFWQGYDPAAPAADRRWRIWSSQCLESGWTVPAVPKLSSGESTECRRMPTAVADHAGGVWLFWHEDSPGAGQPARLRYNRHNGSEWQLTDPGTVPLDGDAAPGLEDDLFALFHPGAGTARLWLFWARQEPVAPADPSHVASTQTRWHVVYRTKRGLDPADPEDWSSVQRLPRDSETHHDRQPAAVASTDGTVELFWTSTRSGGWSLFRNSLTTGTWGSAEEVGSSAYTRSGPLAVRTGEQTLLVYRSNESPQYASATYGATRTVDHRYAGTTTVDTRALAKQALCGTFEDFQTYLYDTGSGGKRSDSARIARDTVGLFLAPDTDDPQEITASLARLDGVVRDFVPVTVRPVFITE